MRCSRLTVLAVILLATMYAPAGDAENHMLDREGPLTCDIHVGLSDFTSPGTMAPIILAFSNSGERRDILVTTGPETVVSARVAVSAGGMTRVCLYVPGSFSSLRGLEYCEFRDAETRELLTEASLSQQVGRFSRRGSRSSHPRPSLISVTVRSSGSFAVHAELDSGYVTTNQTVTPSLLPDRWIGYSGVDVLILEHAVWLRPDFDRRPVIDWMTMGGVCLMVDAPPRAPARIEEELASEAAFFQSRTRPAKPRPAAASSERSEGTPAGFVWTESDGTDPGQRGAGMGPSQDALLVGLGGMIFVGKDDLAESHGGFFMGHGLRPVLLNREGDYESNYSGRGRPVSRQAYPPIAGTGEPPFWPVLVALTLFCVLVGPLGWWYLVSKKKRLMLYYVAAPAISACAMGLIIITDAIKEGFRPRLSCRAVCFLDQRVKRRVEVSQFGVYAPFNVGVALRGTPGELPHFFASDTDSRIEILPSGDTQTYNGVLSARRNTWFAREATALERKRLVVWEEEGRIWAENHLGCDLASLAVSHEGKTATFGPLKQGAKKASDPVVSVRPLGSVSQYITDFDQAAGHTILGKTRDLSIRWQDQFTRGNAYAAWIKGDMGEHVWLDAYKGGDATCLIFGVY